MIDKDESADGLPGTDVALNGAFQAPYEKTT